MPIDYSLFKFKKPETRKRQKGRKDRHESEVKKAVRANVAARDGYCRIQRMFSSPCFGPSEWAHLPAYRRSATKGRAAEERHTTGGTIMLCRHHHDMLDGRIRPKLNVEMLTAREADGLLGFELDGKTYLEAA